MTVAKGVRTFVTAVADGITRDGPSAWRTYFSEAPTFFMVAEGRMAFENSETATRGIQEVAKGLEHIELHWGEPLRIEPLTPTLAMVAAPYHELRIDTHGGRVVEDGYFTGLAELEPAAWRFRNAHWSVSAAPAPKP